uniref:Uncharacterized protein n=2 Tax=Clytia hemisphaerica TaxID=252671 RepID=A0A7M5XAC5_9CNID
KSNRVTKPAYFTISGENKVELMKGFGVYLHRETICNAHLLPETDTCVAYLMKRMFSQQELVILNVTGANGHSPISKNVVNAILGFCLAFTHEGCGRKKDKQQSKLTLPKLHRYIAGTIQTARNYLKEGKDWKVKSEEEEYTQ